MQHAGQLGQETKFVLCVFRRVVTHAKAQRASLVTQRVSLPAVRESRVRALAWEDPLEKEMAIHSRILAWTIPCTVEPGGLQSMGSQESDTTERLTLSRFVFTDPGPALPYPQHGPSSPVPSPATAELLGVEGASPDLAGRFHPLGLQMEGLRPMGVGRGPGHPGRAGARGGHRQDS